MSLWTPVYFMYTFWHMALLSFVMYFVYVFLLYDITLRYSLLLYVAALEPIFVIEKKQASGSAMLPSRPSSSRSNQHGAPHRRARKRAHHGRFVKGHSFPGPGLCRTYFCSQWYAWHKLFSYMNSWFCNQIITKSLIFVQTLSKTQVESTGAGACGLSVFNAPCWFLSQVRYKAQCKCFFGGWCIAKETTLIRYAEINKHLSTYAAYTNIICHTAMQYNTII